MFLAALASLVLAACACGRCAAATTFAATDLAAPGDALPVSLRIVNSYGADISQVELKSDQLFTYRFDLVLPQGQARVLAFAPWYFGGPLLKLEGAASAPGAVWPLEIEGLRPRPLGPQTALLLYDPDDLRPEQLQADQGTWKDYYFPPSAAVAQDAKVQCEPVAALDQVVGLLKDSAVAGLVISARHPNAAALRQATVAEGLDVWVPGQKVPALAVPTILRDLARRTHIRPNLFYEGEGQGEAAGTPASLFSPARWSKGQRLNLALPILVVTLVLICVALLGWRWPRRLTVALVLVTVVGGTVWVIVATHLSQLAVVETVSIAYKDAGSGWAYSEDLAAASALRPGVVHLKSANLDEHPPRPLMEADAELLAYDGVVMSRDLTGRWSVSHLKAGRRLPLAFGTSAWQAQAGPTGELTTVQSNRPELRLNTYEPLDDAYLYVSGQSYRMVGLADDRVYRAQGAPTTVDGAAFAPTAPLDGFRRRAMRWIADSVLRKGVTVFFGWAAAPDAVEATGAQLDNHGRLVIYLLRLPQG